MKQDILHALRRVPQIDGKLRYLPIFQLPAGTLVRFEATDRLTPGELEVRELNTSKEEYDVLRAPAGVYELRTTEMPTMSLTGPDGSTEAVRPLYRCFSAGSLFTANLDRRHESPDFHNEEWATTFRLATGVVKWITIPDVGITLHEDDFSHQGVAFNRRPQPRRTPQRIPLRERI
jgi:hypothetical protein